MLSVCQAPRASIPLVASHEFIGGVSLLRDGIHHAVQTVQSSLNTVQCAIQFVRYAIDSPEGFVEALRYRLSYALRKLIRNF